jgi:LDH2 family malate/lactate/ureidoglycolate dehydrogenase
MKIKITDLEKLCIKILIKKWLNKKDALTVFNEYLDWELRGRECHWFQSLPKFLAKFINHWWKYKIIKETNNLLYIDWSSNLWQIVCNKFVPKLIRKAKKNDIAMMWIKNMHSYLMPWTYARMIAENDLIGFIFNYWWSLIVTPHWSIDPIFWTNPIAIGIPNKDYPIVIDMATSKVAMMKVRLASKLWDKIPNNVAIDSNGSITINPSDVLDWALLPFWWYKWSALSLMVEILTKTMFDIKIDNKNKKNRWFLFIAFNPIIFQDIANFKNNVFDLCKKIKKSRKMDWIDEIFIPWDKSEKTKQKNLKKDYIKINEEIFNELQELL